MRSDVARQQLVSSNTEHIAQSAYPYKKTQGQDIVISLAPLANYHRSP